MSAMAPELPYRSKLNPQPSTGTQLSAVGVQLPDNTCPQRHVVRQPALQASTYQAGYEKC